MSVSSDQFWDLLQEVRQLRVLGARQVELLEEILEAQRRIEAEIVRGLQ